MRTFISLAQCKAPFCGFIPLEFNTPNILQAVYTVHSQRGHIRGPGTSRGLCLWNATINERPTRIQLLFDIFGAKGFLLVQAGAKIYIIFITWVAN